MHVRLTVLTDVQQGAAFSLAAGQEARFGRVKSQSNFCVADRFLAPVHLTLRWNETRCTLQDVSREVRLHRRCHERCFLDELRNARCSPKLCALFDGSGENGVYVNGKQVSEHVLADGDVIVAGTTGLLVALSESPFPPAPAAAEPSKVEPALRLSPSQQQRALALLQEPSIPLFAILDAARDPRLLQQLRIHDEVYYSLYDGEEGEKLAEVAPYLVELPRGSPLTEVLVREHWGSSFGCFLYCDADFKTLRRQLRKFLMVEGPDKASLYFRFYDPRVLRSFLPTCTPAESAEFFGPIARFVTEAERLGGARLFSQGPNGARQDSVSL
jgi:pSer/pThr/pTyr-binding forkhead associated (FHA) protein